MRPIDADALYKDMLYEMCGTGYQSKALSVIRRAPKIAIPPNDPLTLEQLREMDGEPVWDTRWNVWGLLDIGLCRVFTRNGDIDLNMALIEQRLYRYKPSE